jgi:hypothetical protein
MDKGIQAQSIPTYCIFWVIHVLDGPLALILSHDALILSPLYPPPLTSFLDSVALIMGGSLLFSGLQASYRRQAAVPVTFTGAALADPARTSRGRSGNR